VIGFTEEMAPVDQLTAGAATLALAEALGQARAYVSGAEYVQQ